MARDQKSELHLPLAIHRAVAQLTVEVWDQVESERSHRSHRKSKLGEKQPTVPPGGGVRTGATAPQSCLERALSASPAVEAAAGGVQGGPQAFHRLLPTGYAQD